MTEPNPMADMVKLAAYRLAREHLFASEGSLTWFIRKHRAQLIECGALLIHVGQWYANAERFDNYVLQAGQAAAKRHSESAV
jgi:hypothetical protein